ncbi:MAG: hypothetical protein Q9227_005611 [Pyrenula ochraceoflavens]
MAEGLGVAGVDTYSVADCMLLREDQAAVAFTVAVGVAVVGNDEVFEAPAPTPRIEDSGVADVKVNEEDVVAMPVDRPSNTLCVALAEELELTDQYLPES